MDVSKETIQMAESILSSIDANEEFIEHHGVKGQKHGVRRYQNEDGSLTTLGRHHYGIGLGSWIKSRFSSAERGYRAAVKQKQQQQKIAVQKAKYAGNLKKMLKNKKYFTDEEIDKQIATDTRRQQAINRLNELSRADKLQRKAEKQADQDRADARKEAKFQQKMQKEAIKSQERQHKLEQQTMLDIQKQKDTAQAEREQAQREYQTQQQIAKGKTLLGRLQKLAALSSSISTIAGNGKKLADAIGIDTSGFIDSWKPKKEENTSNKDNKDKPKGDNKDNPKGDNKDNKDKPKGDNKDNPKGDNKDNKDTGSKNRMDFDLSGWDPNTKYTWSIDNQGGNQNKPRLNLDLSGWDPNNKQTWHPSNETGQKKKISIDLSGWDPNTQYTWNKEGTHQKKLQEEMKNAPQYIDTANDKDKSRGIKVLELNSNSRRNWSTQEEWLAKKAKEQDFKDMVDSISYYNNKEKNERKIIRQAQERAQEIIENARTVKMNSTGPLSDTVKYVTSLGSTKLANMLSGEIPNSIPNKINLGSLMNAKIEQKPTYLEELRANKKIKHEDMDEEEIAGEVEDAE